MSDLISRTEIISTFTELGKTGRYGGMCEWVIEIVKQLPPAELSTNLAEVGTDLARTVKGFPIDADLLMLKAEEEYGFRTRDRLYELIRTMPKYELPSVQPKRGKWIDKGWTGDWQYLTDGRGNCWRNVVCSECGESVRHESNFCPNCGADMRGERDG